MWKLRQRDIGVTSAGADMKVCNQGGATWGGPPDQERAWTPSTDDLADDTPDSHTQGLVPVWALPSMLRGHRSLLLTLGPF